LSSLPSFVVFVGRLFLFCWDALTSFNVGSVRVSIRYLFPHLNTVSASNVVIDSVWNSLGSSVVYTQTSTNFNYSAPVLDTPLMFPSIVSNWNWTNWIDTSTGGGYLSSQCGGKWSHRATQSPLIYLDADGKNQSLSNSTIFPFYSVRSSSYSQICQACSLYGHQDQNSPSRLNQIPIGSLVGRVQRGASGQNNQNEAARFFVIGKEYHGLIPDLNLTAPEQYRLALMMYDSLGGERILP